MVLAAASCGESILPGPAFEEALFEIGGTINPAGGLQGFFAAAAAEASRAPNPKIGLLWTDPFQRRSDVPMPARALASSVDVTADSFVLQIFRPPPSEAVIDVESASAGAPLRVAFAEIVLFDDRDGDGTFTVSGPAAEINGADRFLAGSIFVLSYVVAPNPFAQASTPVSLAGQTGYAVIDIGCKGQLVKMAGMADPAAVELLLQPSRRFPEVRTCLRTHSP